ncbi:MAG: hypothetical protein WCF94_04210 [bacterium]
MRKTYNYKGVKVNNFGIPNFLTKEDVGRPTNTKKKYNQYKIFVHNFKLVEPRNQLVIYNIPNKMRKERDWFRRHLKKFNYLMIQKDIWVGPSPLPTDFIAYTKSINLLDKITILKLVDPYTKK